MHQIIMAIIDGTGKASDQDYRLDMRHSFCVQIAEGMGLYVNGPSARSLRAHYQRGPSLDGASTYARGMEAYQFLKSVHRFHPNAQLMLAGYSRGGSSAVYAASALKAEKIPVAAMFLFDPVARQVVPGGEVVPDNVEALWVASRAFNEALVRKYDGRFTTIAKTIGSNPTIQMISPIQSALAARAGALASDWLHPMRPGFGKTATQYAGPTDKHHKHRFAGSHGALGGVGWINVDEDATCQLEVAQWMTGAMRLSGLEIPLKAYQSTQKWE